MLLLGVWCLEEGDCTTDSLSVFFAVIIGGSLALGLAAASWAVFKGARFALTGRSAAGIGRAIAVAVGCLLVAAVFTFGAFTA